MTTGLKSAFAVLFLASTSLALRAGAPGLELRKSNPKTPITRPVQASPTALAGPYWPWLHDEDQPWDPWDLWGPWDAEDPAEKEAAADGPCDLEAYRAFKKCGNNYACYKLYTAAVAKCDELNNP